MDTEQRVERVINAPVRVLGTEVLLRDMFTASLHAVVVLRRRGEYFALCEPWCAQARKGE